MHSARCRHTTRFRKCSRTEVPTDTSSRRTASWCPSFRCHRDLKELFGAQVNDVAYRVRPREKLGPAALGFNGENASTSASTGARERRWNVESRQRENASIGAVGRCDRDAAVETSASRATPAPRPVAAERVGDGESFCGNRHSTDVENTIAHGRRIRRTALTERLNPPRMALVVHRSTRCRGPETLARPVVVASRSAASDGAVRRWTQGVTIRQVDGRVCLRTARRPPLRAVLRLALCRVVACARPVGRSMKWAPEAVAGLRGERA